MLRLLTQLGDDELLEEFIAEVVTRDYDGTDNADLVASAGLLGAEKTGRLYAELVGRHMRLLHGCCVALLRALAAASDTSRMREWSKALQQIADAAVSRLDEVGKKERENDWMDWRVSEEAPTINAALVADLLDLLVKLALSALRTAAAEKFIARPAVFDVVTVLVPALAVLHERDVAAQRLWEHSAGFLLERSGVPPESPKDWRQDVKVACKCADCRELQAFTRDPAEQTHRFRVRQDRRQHLHQQIERHGLDMTHVTERKGSPQTLLCTKDRRSYKGRCEQYRRDVAALACLEEQAQKSPTGNEGTLKRIAAARALAAQWRPE